MKLHLFDQLSQSQKSAFAVVFVTLLPFFFPNLFHPLGRASPSMFSVSPFYFFTSSFLKFKFSYMYQWWKNRELRLWLSLHFLKELKKKKRRKNFILMMTQILESINYHCRSGMLQNLCTWLCLRMLCNAKL